MHALPDPFDPNSWALQPDHEFRVYADARASRWGIVDEIDYHWAVHWCWNIKRCRAAKEYLRRAVAMYGTVNGKVERTCCVSLYLHIEIMKRTGIEPPTPLHKLVDHRNGNSLDCRRKNLRWATNSMNSRNLYGKHSHDLEELPYA